jgi:hypothetical protein
LFVVVVMMMVMRGRRERRSGGRSGFLRDCVSGEANNKRGGRDNCLDHEQAFPF